MEARDKKQLEDPLNEPKGMQAMVSRPQGS